jgi:transcriptional regulator with XRE-family HTH domain
LWKTSGMFNENLRFLRQKRQMSQQAFASILGIPRTTYSEYEKGNTEPNLKLLIRLSELLDVSLDNLISDDLTHNDREIFRNEEIRILAMTMDAVGQNYIELVETKAEAGYMNSMSDPEYIADLPKIAIPSLQNGRYRAFEIFGDSMLPMESGSIILSKYVEALKDIKDDKTYIIITHKDGVVYKRVKKIDDEAQLLAISDNSNYRPYLIPYNEIQEMWQYHAHIGFSDMKVTFQSVLEEKINDIHLKVNQILQTS